MRKKNYKYIIFGFIGCMAILTLQNRAEKKQPLIKTNAPPKDMIEIIAANKNIKPSSIIKKADLKWYQISKQDMKPEYITKLESSIDHYVGYHSMIPLHKNQFIKHDYFISLSTGHNRSLSHLATKDMTILTLKADGLSSNYIKPGEKINIIFVSAPTRISSKNQGQIKAGILLKNIEVIAVDKATIYSKLNLKQKWLPPKDISVLVSHAQSVKLQLASKIGQLSFAIVSLKNQRENSRKKNVTDNVHSESSLLFNNQQHIMKPKIKIIEYRGDSVKVN